MISLNKYEEKKKRLIAEFAEVKRLNKKVLLKKKTVSNLFRYGDRNKTDAATISLSKFNNIINIDVKGKILEVEGLVTYEKIVDYCLNYNLVPLVTPELKNITIGGATVGIGIESTCYKYGFVHDGLVEVDVLTPNGDVLTCTRINKNKDLFNALGNSYGTLGYVLRAKIKLYDVKPYVHIKNIKFDNVKSFIDSMYKATTDPDVEFIEALIFSKNELYLMLSKCVDKTPYLDDVYRGEIFYKLPRKKRDIYLTIKDYIFRYDPDWFWNFPERPFYKLFRKIAPKGMRNSGFYTRYINWKKKFFNEKDEGKERLIQDWEVPWDKAIELTNFALNNVNLGKNPWLAVPIKVVSSATIYPLKKNQLYYNLGCYCYVDKVKGKEDYYYTKIMDKKCFALKGLKMLYSSTFISKKEFDNLYNGKKYTKLKKKYDPDSRFRYLYEKVVQRR
ncbi:FAD-binding oxidoreductase [Candidatus Woesearchaeota archaeon]|nr:FAD-binding oxidoreductase [Candidatus Woesearchaeota archaeon]